jgi:hypothetical protein
MSKKIVTHINPDPDAITSVWLLRRFHPEFTRSGVAFVPAGKTFEDQPADSDPNVVHVDTGMGEFDHHQTSERTCAAKLVLEFLQINIEFLREDEALERLVEVVLDGDHFEECYWPDATNDRYNFMFGEMLNGLKHNNTLSDHGLVDLGSTCLDGIYTSLKMKVDAQKEIEKGREFKTEWGKGLFMETKNDDVLGLAQMMGNVVVVRRDPENGMVRMKAQPRSDVDFSQIYEQVRKLDPEATWFLHASKKMLLNGSYKNPESVFSKLSASEILGLFA